MIYYLKDNAYEKEALKNAGSKAREDCEDIFEKRGYLPVICNITNDKYDNYDALKKAFSSLQSGDCLILSIVLYFKTINIKNILIELKKKNVKIVVFVHDLNVIRRGFNYFEPWVRFSIPNHEAYNEEFGILKNADYIVAHNYKMKKLLEKSFKKSIIFSLDCFDYLSNCEETNENDNNEGIVIAGNLSKEKSLYLYSLPKENHYYLYGVGFDESFIQSNIKYCGSLFPNELIPNICNYSFGMIWDGNSNKKCSGRYGNYSKINNPHKLSLYLAAGLPVIVWKKAAIAKFVEDNKVGICVNNLDEIDNKIKDTNYKEIKENAICIGNKIKKGYFLNKCLDRLEAFIK